MSTVRNDELLRQISGQLGEILTCLRDPLPEPAPAEQPPAATEPEPAPPVEPEVPAGEPVVVTGEAAPADADVVSPGPADHQPPAEDQADDEVKTVAEPAPAKTTAKKAPVKKTSRKRR